MGRDGWIYNLESLIFNLKSNGSDRKLRRVLDVTEIARYEMRYIF